MAMSCTDPTLTTVRQSLEAIANAPPCDALPSSAQKERTSWYDRCVRAPVTFAPRIGLKRGLIAVAFRQP